MTGTREQVVNITKAIGEAPVSALLIRVGILCAAVAFLDGIDSSSIAVAAPLIAEKLRLSQTYLGPIFSSALLGTMLGALSFGPLADRVGQKRMLLVATLIFGVFTIATAAAGSFRTLLLIRFLAGIGLGGATPCFLALAAEYAPKAHRSVVVSLVWTAYPFGAFLGSFLSAYLLPRFGWPAIFLIGGSLPLLVFVALLIWLPESIRFLLLKGRDGARIHHIVSRIVPSLHSAARFVADEENISGAPLRNLFSHGRTVETLLLWLSFLAVFGAVAMVFLWTPTVMHDHGVSPARASIAYGLGGIGGLLGSACAGRLMQKFGAAAVLGSSLLIGAMGVATMSYAASSLVLATIDIALISFCVGGMGTSGALALAAGTYPAAMRSTGVGWATGMGRFGQVLTPLLTSWLMAIGWRLDRVFLTMAFALCLGAISIVLLERRKSASESGLLRAQFNPAIQAGSRRL